MNPTCNIIQGDCLAVLKTLPDQSVNCCVTSPPYWGLRDYGVAGQLGIEKTPQEYVEKMTAVFREVRRVLRGDGTLWLNLGDSYASGGNGGNPIYDGSQPSGRFQGIRPGGEPRKGWKKPPSGLKHKDLVGIPWRVAFALQADGWYLRQDIIWHKPNPMPESVTDRCTKAHEYVFLLSKSERYHYDADAVSEESVSDEQPRNRPNGMSVVMGKQQGAQPNCGVTQYRNRRSVWTVPTSSYPEAHFATFPPALIKPCILAGCPVGGTVLDPFGGSGTTGQVSLELARSAILIELNPEYIKLANRRTSVTPSML